MVSGCRLGSLQVWCVVGLTALMQQPPPEEMIKLVFHGQIAAQHRGQIWAQDSRSVVVFVLFWLCKKKGKLPVPALATSLAT